MHLTKVLIVDDSPALQQIYKVVLSRYKCQTISALSGQDGLNALADNPDVKLLIVDIEMPAMSGLEFVRNVKGQTAYRDVPIIIVSTKGKESVVQEALAFAQGHLIKPFTSNEVHVIIEGLFARTDPAANP